MSENNIFIKWSLISAFVYLIWGIIGALINIENSFIHPFLLVLVLLFPIIMASFEFRDKLNNSFASLGEIFKLGLKITLVLVLVAGIWSYVHPKYINENYIENEMLKARIEMEEYGLTDEMIDESLEMTESFMSQANLVIFDKVVKVFLLGLLISLVSGLTIRNERPIPELNSEEN